MSFYRAFDKLAEDVILPILDRQTSRLVARSYQRNLEYRKLDGNPRSDWNPTIDYFVWHSSPTRGSTYPSGTLHIAGMNSESMIMFEVRIRQSSFDLEVKRDMHSCLIDSISSQDVESIVASFLRDILGDYD